MTGGTVVDHTRMVKDSGSETAGNMAGTAIRHCRDMPQPLAGCRYPIVTGGATIDDP